MKEGSTVIVKVGEKDDCFGVIGKYNGREMTVSRKRTICNCSYYELEGAVSEKGIPYTFLSTHLEEVGA